MYHIFLNGIRSKFRQRTKMNKNINHWDSESMHQKQEQLSLKWAHHYFFSKYNFLQERHPWLTGAPTQLSRSHKWSRLTASLMSSPMVLSHSVKSKVWIVKGPRGQCCITMTSTHKTNTRILPNISWSASFMSHSASGLLSFMVQNIMDKKDAIQLNRLRKTISQWTQSPFCCSSFRHVTYFYFSSWKHIRSSNFSSATCF